MGRREGEGEKKAEPIHLNSNILPFGADFTDIQGGAEPTDTFQMVIDNIWKRKNKRNHL